MKLMLSHENDKKNNFERDDIFYTKLNVNKLILYPHND